MNFYETLYIAIIAALAVDGYFTVRRIARNLKR